MGNRAQIKHKVKDFFVTKDDANHVLIKYWQIIVVVMALAVSYGSTRSDMSAMADDLQEQKQEQKSAADDRVDVKMSVALMQKDISSINNRLDRMQKQTVEAKKEILDAIKNQ